MRPIASMHDTVSAYAVAANGQTDNFRRVTVTHAVYSDTGNVTDANNERSPINAAMVTMRLADGGYVTVWPDGTIQVSDSQGAASTNYRAHTATQEIDYVGRVAE